MSAERLSLGLVVMMALQAGLSLAFPQLYRDTGYVGETWYGNDLVTLAVTVPCLVGGIGGYLVVVAIGLTTIWLGM